MGQAGGTVWAKALTGPSMVLSDTGEEGSVAAVLRKEEGVPDHTRGSMLFKL